MRVPDLSHMIQVEEIHASGNCIHCGKVKSTHNFVWRADTQEFAWQCYVGVASYYDTGDREEGYHHYEST